MIRPVSRHACSVAAFVLVLAGCGALATQERRAAQGPSAEEIWTARVVLDTGHEPTFDEKQRWDDQMDQRISQYLARNPALANSLNVTTFRITRQVTVGMERDLVLLLIGPPVLFAKDTAEIEKLARRFWPQVKNNNPKEAWLYPQGWRLFVDDTRVVDITQYLEP